MISEEWIGKDATGSVCGLTLRTSPHLPALAEGKLQEKISSLQLALSGIRSQPDTCRITPLGRLCVKTQINHTTVLYLQYISNKAGETPGKQICIERIWRIQYMLHFCVWLRTPVSKCACLEQDVLFVFFSNKEELSIINVFIFRVVPGARRRWPPSMTAARVDPCSALYVLVTWTSMPLKLHSPPRGRSLAFRSSSVRHIYAAFIGLSLLIRTDEMRNGYNQLPSLLFTRSRNGFHLSISLTLQITSEWR
jgi:hypothetical protein